VIIDRKQQPGASNTRLFRLLAAAHFHKFSEDEAEQVEAATVELVDVIDDLQANTLGSTPNTRGAP
jgi:hypothetical protein